MRGGERLLVNGVLGVKFLALRGNFLAERLVGTEHRGEALDLLGIEDVHRLHQFAIDRIVEVKTREGIALANLVLVGERFFHGELAGDLLNARQVRLAIPMPPSTEDLYVVEGRAGPIHLQRKVRAFLVDDRVLGVNKMLGIEMRHRLVTDKLNRHRVPLAGLKVIRAFAVAHGEPRPSLVERGLQVKVIAANVDHRVVVP